MKELKCYKCQKVFAKYYILPIFKRYNFDFCDDCLDEKYMCKVCKMSIRGGAQCNKWWGISCKNWSKRCHNCTCPNKVGIGI